MVQKEVRKKAQAYGLMAILLASMCVALIYSVGTGPSISPQPNPSPNPTNEVSPMNTFSSYDELKTFLAAGQQGDLSSSPQGAGYFTTFSGQRVFSESNGMPVPAPMPTTMPAAAPPQGGTTGDYLATSEDTKDYSTTNTQVAGVDEADTVKTDGKYLYVISNNTIFIVNADPQNAKVMSKISYPDTSFSGLFLSQDGSRLAVVGSKYETYTVDSTDQYGMMKYYFTTDKTFVGVYDVSDKANPVLARNFTMSGDYYSSNSRMIGDYVYVVVTQPAYAYDNTVIVPRVYSGTQGYDVAPTSIYYANSSAESTTSYGYTTFVALNILNAAEAPSNMTIMLGYTGQIYVSTDNIYVTYPDMRWEEKTVPSSSAGAPAPVPMPIMRTPTWQGTAIYRIHIAGNSMTFAAQGNVTGTALDQYSMDEYNGYFRIITTSYDYGSATSSDLIYRAAVQQNNVYVLDMNLNVVGKVENLGSGENFHSSRFMGNRCYMVTFMTIDPLFVIDLSQPTNPQVLGNLTMPGYSDYLHPYDETHLIGLGKDTVETNNNFALYLGLKLSLFDVSDVNNPREVAKIIIGDRGTNSEALDDPHAFLFNRTKNLLVIPVELYLVSNESSSSNPEAKLVPPVPAPTTTPGTGTSNQGTTPSRTPSTTPSFVSPPSGAYGQFVWQGAYVFTVTLNGGFEVRGNITQLSNETLATLAQNNGYYYYGGNDVYNYFITRTLYIGNTLYTISEGRVQLNNLDNMALIAKVELS